MSGIVGSNLGRGSGLVKSGGVGADAVGGANIADDAVDSEHIADNAVGLAALASGTDGQIITYDASGNPTAVGPGTDGQVLTSTGAGSPPAFEASAGFDVSSITGATELAVEPATTDELVLSDAGTLKRLDFKHIYNTPFVMVGGGTSLYPTNAASTLVTWGDETMDTDTCFNATGSTVTLNSLSAPAYSFVPNVAGVYQININIYFAGEGVDGASGQEIAIQTHFNGSHYYDMHYQPEKGSGVDDEAAGVQLNVCIPFNGSGDYFQTYIYQNTGETPELNFGYSSMTIHRLNGTGTASRPDYG